MSFEYLPIVLYISLGIVLGLLIIVLNYLLSAPKANIEKLSAYECGFNPYTDTRRAFDVRFYLVALMFIIFDLEVIFLFPFITVFTQITNTGFLLMLVFLIVLSLGLYYEWKKGALEWE
jgi:NADH-quinone oxidoreductase subunit A